MAEKLGGVTAEGVSRDILRMLVFNWVNEQFTHDYAVLSPEERVLGAFHHQKEAFEQSLSFGDDKIEVFNFCIRHKPQEYLGIGFKEILDMDFYNYEIIKEKMIEFSEINEKVSSDSERNIKKLLGGGKK